MTDTLTERAKQYADAWWEEWSNLTHCTGALTELQSTIAFAITAAEARAEARGREAERQELAMLWLLSGVSALTSHNKGKALVYVFSVYSLAKEPIERLHNKILRFYDVESRTGVGEA